MSDSAPRGPQPDLNDQVNAARAAIDNQRAELSRQGAPKPVRDRRIPAVIAALVFAASLAWQWPALSGSATDPEIELGATIGAIDMARAAVETHWDSAGTPPASLTVLGLGDLPFAYRASDREFTIAALSPFGDSIGYQSPTRMPRAEGQ
jgi:hypothetical protein